MEFVNKATDLRLYIPKTKVKMNVCGVWPFAQISNDFCYLGIWQCARYFVAALFKELALITIREVWGLESRSRSRTSRSRSRSRLLWQSLGLGLVSSRNLSQVSMSEVTVSTTSLEVQRFIYDLCSLREMFEFRLSWEYFMYEFKPCQELQCIMYWYELVSAICYYFVTYDLLWSIKYEYKLIKKSVQCDIREMTYRGYELTIRGCQAGLVFCEHDPGFSNENPIKDSFPTGSKSCLCHLTQVAHHVSLLSFVAVALHCL